MLVILSNGNGSSHCIYHIEDHFLSTVSLHMGHKSVIMVKIFIKGKSQRGLGMEHYSVNSALGLTQYNITHVLKIGVDSDLCQRNLEGI